MEGGHPGQFPAAVDVACERILVAATAIAEAYEFGVGEGKFEEPWTLKYHRVAVYVYAESLPASYQRRVGELFRSSDAALSRGSIPAAIAADWSVVRAYLRHAATAIEEWLEVSGAYLGQDGPPKEREIHGPPPRVIHFDRLAALTTLAGANRLRQAAGTVRKYCQPPEPLVLSSREQQLLRALRDGVYVVDLAADSGYSERAMYRELARLWKKLGVKSRKEGLRKATESRLLD